jgi:hypothetical protein
MVAHICHSSYLGRINRKIMSKWAKMKDPISKQNKTTPPTCKKPKAKRAWGMVQLVESLPTIVRSSVPQLDWEGVGERDAKLGRWRHKGQKFKASLGYTATPS